MKIQTQYQSFQSEFEPIQQRDEFNYENWVYEYFTMDSIDLDQQPPDPDLIIEIGAANCARLGILPWRDIGQSTVIFIDNLAREENVRIALASFSSKIVFLPLARTELINRLHSYAGRYMLREARDYCPKSLSVRKLYTRHYKLIAVSISISVIAFCYLFPYPAVFAFMMISMLLVLGNSLLRFAAITRFIRVGHKEVEKPVECTLEDEDLPIFSILIPLYREPELIEQVIRAIDATNYPH